MTRGVEDTNEIKHIKHSANPVHKGDHAANRYRTTSNYTHLSMNVDLCSIIQ